MTFWVDNILLKTIRGLIFRIMLIFMRIPYIRTLSHEYQINLSSAVDQNNEIVRIYDSPITQLLQSPIILSSASLMSIRDSQTSLTLKYAL